MATILIVDDDHATRNLLCRLFERTGFSVLSADSGESAIAQLHLAQVAMMLLDISMPGMDGLETLRRIRANPATQKQTVVMYTALDLEDHRSEAERLNVADYWVKGQVHFGEMEKRVRSLVQPNA